MSLNQQRGELDRTIASQTTELAQLNARVKALGEDEQLALQAKLATQDAEAKQLQRQQADLVTTLDATAGAIAQSEATLQQHQDTMAHLQHQQTAQTLQVTTLNQQCVGLAEDVEQKRQAADAIASASDVWVQQQASLRHDIDELLRVLDPLRTEQIRLQERIQQLEQRIQTQTESLEQQQTDVTRHQQDQAEAHQRHQAAIVQVQSLAQTLAAAEQEVDLQRDTQTRLLDEQRQKQRTLDKLEAKAQAQQESQGTYATKVLLQTGLPGVCGLVAQLGRVDERYQRALEIAAGGRLGFLVVEDDRVASAGIRLLKEKRSGRATFLPLNKIRAPRISKVSAWQRPDGFVDYAADLIDYDPQYQGDLCLCLWGNGGLRNPGPGPQPHGEIPHGDPRW